MKRVILSLIALSCIGFGVNLYEGNDGYAILYFLFMLVNGVSLTIQTVLDDLEKNK